MAFVFEEQAIKGVFVITPQVFGDQRGYFMETYKKEPFEAAGIPGEFVQDNESSSTKGVLRGLHFQKEHTQGKLVRVLSGKVFDVAVDIRKSSPTFGQYVGVELSDANKLQFWVPEGFAHGFYVMSEEAVFAYKCTDYYDPTSEHSIMWDDPTLDIAWPVIKGVKINLSEKDLNRATSFKDAVYFD